MKKVKLSFVIGIVLFLLVGGGQSLFAQSREEMNAGSKEDAKAKLESRMKELIDKGSFRIDVNRAIPASGESEYLTSAYSVELRSDSILSYLPYYGQAYSVPYGGGDGLIFNKPVSDYSISYGKKGEATIKFRTRSDDDTYMFNIQVFPGGSTTIHVTPVNKQSITFYGNVAPETLRP